MLKMTKDYYKKRKYMGSKVESPTLSLFPNLLQPFLSRFTITNVLLGVIVFLLIVLIIILCLCCKKLFSIC